MIYWEEESRKKVHNDNYKSLQQGAKMAQKVKTISIYCSKCNSILYKYHKGGRGGLVKCIPKKIVKDYTNQDLKCPKCEQQFARIMYIRNQPAHKIIQGKVYTKGMSRK